MILAAALTGIGLAVLSATSRTVALPVAASALSAQLGAAAVVMVILRMLFQPGPNEFIDLEGGIFVALVRHGADHLRRLALDGGGDGSLRAIGQRPAAGRSRRRSTRRWLSLRPDDASRAPPPPASSASA